ncbi:DUF2515 family protein [Priestia endophytica]|jgi:hypothetical protein|uniref:DUF2515 domain-containing protein n=1 Tax=Priestia endophytica DSM 13796 TaxID=1121089 RepID=A0A1I5Y018_9BACI|nr:DUF2515 family protein [Priestia endophytica]KYG31479.1 hypothetical protein AZF06_06995 [Priestia endophytica]MBG9811650.1 hypothetical protein [Priestia endophytica]SFQ37297.1 Protein of unknown function [Priestia endophytica DSM 13796]
MNEQEIVDYIIKETEKANIDNISRTEAYYAYFKRHKEIEWAFLASMVSRNAGWNMCDLEGAYFSFALKKNLRKRLFLTYERANWLIFKDAYPQLLLYELSKKKKKSLFSLLSKFDVHSFMEEEWTRFWEEGKKKRLVHALVVNEQHIIQQPVISHPVYQKRVFSRPFFKLQEMLHFSSVLFPTIQGELYGLSVYNFLKVEERIELGVKLSELLFHRELFTLFDDFASSTPHTGSRYDYEQYFRERGKIATPHLRSTFRPVAHHETQRDKWVESKEKLERWLVDTPLVEIVNITRWYKKKQRTLHFYMLVEGKMKEIIKWK